MRRPRSEDPQWKFSFLMEDAGGIAGQWQDSQKLLYGSETSAGLGEMIQCDFSETLKYSHGVSRYIQRLECKFILKDSIILDLIFDFRSCGQGGGA